MAEPSAELVRAAQAGDPRALAALLESQQTYVYSLALSLMRNPADAADMTQEAFVRLLRVLPSYRAETKFTTWLYRLVTNICLDGLRRRGRQAATSLDEATRGSGAAADDAPPLSDLLVDEDRATQPAAEAEAREEAAAVRAALAELPPSQRAALALHYFEDLRYEEIADILGLPLNTVKSHIRRGKERMAAILLRYERDENGASEEQPCSASR